MVCFQVLHLVQFLQKTVDGRHPAPVEVGSLFRYLQGSIHPNGGVCRISEPSTVPSAQEPLAERAAMALARATWYQVDGVLMVRVWSPKVSLFSTWISKSYGLNPEELDFEKVLLSDLVSTKASWTCSCTIIAHTSTELTYASCHLGKAGKSSTQKRLFWDRGSYVPVSRSVAEKIPVDGNQKSRGLPHQPPFGCVWNLENNGISTTNLNWWNRRMDLNRWNTISGEGCSRRGWVFHELLGASFSTHNNGRKWMDFKMIGLFIPKSVESWAIRCNYT